MNKKQIIIAAGAGLLSFGVTFAAAFMLLGPAPPPPEPAASQQTETPEQPTVESTAVFPADMQITERRETKKGLSEKRLNSLVYEVREKINDYQGKVRGLEVREARLQMTQETLKNDIDELNGIRVELATLVVNLKEQRKLLLETRTQIEESEKANLASIAATYDKMDPASASKIIRNMCASQVETGRVRGGAMDDAVKILFYMTERTKAKLLAELVATEPKLTAVLCQRLKEIVEQK